MRLIVDRFLCDGNGLCADEAPTLLRLDDNDEPQLLANSFGEDDLAAAGAAVRVCPKAALAIGAD